MACIFWKRIFTLGLLSGDEKDAGRVTRALPLAGPSYVVWGANTDVGKTLISAAICNYVGRAGLTPGGKGNAVFYYKPVQTGFPEDSDADTVASVCGGHTEFGDHAGQLLAVGGDVTDFPEMIEDPSLKLDLTARTEFAWSHPVSPHLAVQMEGRAVSDEELVTTCMQTLATYTQEMQVKTQGDAKKMYTLVETAGAVNSPAPSGRSQGDVYRALRLPGILVGDGRLGGIASTMSAMESLMLRGLDVSCVIVHDKGFRNEEAIEDMMKYVKTSAGQNVPVFVLPPIPRRRTQRAGSAALRSWILQCHDKLKKIKEKMDDDHWQRIAKLRSSSREAVTSLWWPFTQHDLVREVTVIDSRHGEDWWVFKTDGQDGVAGERLQSVFDGPASWWTQGVDEKLHVSPSCARPPRLPAHSLLTCVLSQLASPQVLLNRAIAYGAGRYGHVLFPENATEVSLELTKRLLHGVGKGWASRVFFSDNGSTAVEVGIKMALRKYMHDHALMGETDQALEALEFGILGLDGSYHGDTLAAMDVQAPSVFTGPKQMPWYKPRGHWLAPPMLSMQKGAWVLEVPDSLRGSSPFPADSMKFASWEAASNVEARKNSPIAAIYRRHIDEEWSAILQRAGPQHHVAAVVMEAVLHGAGGMNLIDPLFQHILADAAKARKVPVVMDEVFSGFWRLGARSSSAMASIKPDVACYAKLLTGGTLPLAVTLASEPIFEAFRGQEKSYGLLHGHSYTAHPIGCSVAIAALDAYQDAEMNDNYDASNDVLRSLWPKEVVLELSHHEAVRRVVPLGTVLIVELNDGDGAGGYQSSASKPVIAALRQHNIFARPLGNVVYLMVTPTTDAAKCAHLASTLLKCLPSR